jgi:hypothetical protein
MVEQWTENPCVPGSIPGGTTRGCLKKDSLFYFIPLQIITAKVDPKSLVLKILYPIHFY